MSATKEPYKIPDPDKRPDSFLTCFYKTLKGVEYDNREWDKVFFARCNKRTAQLLENLGGDVRRAVKCMQDLKEQFEADGISWTIETLVGYSFEWDAKNKHRTDRDAMRRFVSGLVKEHQGLALMIDAPKLVQEIKAKAIRAADPSEEELPTIEDIQKAKEQAGLTPRRETNGNSAHGVPS